MGLRVKPYTMNKEYIRSLNMHSGICLNNAVLCMRKASIEARLPFHGPSLFTLVSPCLVDLC